MTLSPIEYISSKPRRKKRPLPPLLKGLLLIGLFAGGLGIYKVAAPRVLASEVGRGPQRSLEALIEEYNAMETARGSFITAALERTKHQVTYDPAYYEISYPMGDLPKNKGVCTDVVIRSFRKIGVDLQALVHEDMSRHFAAYPKTWGLKATDRNIDHRRVPNLQTFFARHGQSLTISQNPDDYLPGDLVVWRLSHGAPHIGIVVPSRQQASARPFIVHNIGGGPQWEDNLFQYEITGHYRYAVD